MSNLKECPFCNGIPRMHIKYVEHESVVSVRYYIKCTNCGAETTLTYREDSAEELWNMRGRMNER